jgi:hypothetical protein
MGNNRMDRKPARKRAAEERQAAWAQLTFTQQRFELDLRLGTNLGAVRQRNRINKAIEKDTKND